MSLGGGPFINPGGQGLVNCRETVSGVFSAMAETQTDMSEEVKREWMTFFQLAEDNVPTDEWLAPIFASAARVAAEKLGLSFPKRTGR